MNNSTLDPDAFFDQQTSVFLEQSQGRKSQTPLRFSNLNTSATYFLDNLGSRVASVEDRLNACDSIYRLAAQANSVREKERRENHQNLVKYANSLDQRLSKIEATVSSIPQMIKDIVHEEMKQYDTTAAVAQQVELTNTKFGDRITTIEKQLVDNNKKVQKNIKKLRIETQMAKAPEDDSRVEEITMQLSEMKRRQTLMFDLLNALRSHNDQDYDGVNSQLNDLWSQLSSKRPNE